MALAKKYNSKEEAQEALRANIFSVKDALVAIHDDDSLWATAYPREDDGASMILQDPTLSEVREKINSLIHDLY